MNSIPFLIGVSLIAGAVLSIHFIPIIEEQLHYLSLDEAQGEEYVLNEMSCPTLLASVQLIEHPEIKPKMIDGVCWDHCQVLRDDYTPERDHYFIHINENIDYKNGGYKYFLGLDERVEECK